MPLTALLLVFTLAYRREWLRDPRLAQQAVVAALALSVVLAVVVMGQTSSTVSLQDPYVDTAPPLGLEFLRGFLSPGLAPSRFENLVGFFEAPGYSWLYLPVVLSLLVTFYRILTRTTTFSDIVVLFLALFIALVVFQTGALLAGAWALSRYLFILALPGFLLLGAEGLARLLRGLVYVIARLARSAAGLEWSQAAIPLGGALLVIAMRGPDAWDFAHRQATGHYHTAFAYVREHWEPGDKVMTFHPAAAYLYLGRCDYYANQMTAKVLQGLEDEEAPIDRYTGSPLVDSVEGLSAALNEAQRLWFVVDKRRLYERYTPFFSQQVFAEMDIAHQAGDVYVFVSHPYPTPLPAEPTATLHANFDDLISLEGYSLDPRAIAPDGSVSVGLYWRPVGDPSRTLKVFVQLRNGKGEIIAQADHFIHEGLLTSREWNRLRETGEWLRDSADLHLPLPLNSAGGPYRLYVGLYDPDTLERVPVLNDVSGENAAVIELVEIP